MSPIQSIKVTLRGNLQEIDTFWLRDHCRCQLCYNYATFQRKTSILDIPDDISTSDFKIEGDKLNVLWSDGHSSCYDVDFLVKNLSPPTEPFEKILWTKETFNVDETIQMCDFLTKPEAKKAVLRNLYLYGVAFIDGVEPTEENTELCIKNLFQVQKTFFGEMWTFSDANLDHSDTAYTNCEFEIIENYSVDPQKFPFRLSRRAQ
jgi:trimethyllysine dioxygenase